MEKLTKRVGKDGFSLSWQHIKALVNVDKDSWRVKLVEYVFKHATSAAELAEKIRDKRGGARSQGGRRPEAPKNANQGLGQVTSRCKQLNVRAEVWEEGVFKKILDTPPDDYDPVLLRKLQEAKEQADEAKGSIELICGGLDKCLKKVERFLGDAEAEAEAESDSEPSKRESPRKRASKGAKDRAEQRPARKKKRKSRTAVTAS